MCNICYFYKHISINEFWRLHEEGYPLAPYNTGRAAMAEEQQEWLYGLCEARDWRAYLLSQPGPTFLEFKRSLIGYREPQEFRPVIT